MSDLTKARLWVALAFFLALAWFVWGIGVAQASDDCRGNSCNGGADVDVDVGGDTINIGGDTINGGDVSVPVDITGGSANVQQNSDSFALGLANGLGDVDIAGCLGSTQWATPIFSKQKLTVNWPCLAEFYLRNGKPELAAMAICNTEVVKEFDTEADCEAAHNFTVLAAAPPEPVEHDRDDELERRLEINQAYTAELESRLNDLETLAQRAPEQRTVIQQVPTLSDTQKAALAELRGE